MANNREQLTLREIELLQDLQEIASKSENISHNIDDKLRSLDRKDLEIASLKRELEEYKEENARLRELIHTWRNKLDTVLKQVSQFIQP